MDDQESMCETLEVLFGRAGWEVTTSTDSRRAAELLREPPGYDLVVTDLVMPLLDGMEILEIARDANPECQVIVITAHSTTEAAVSAMKLGAYDYIQKPFSMNEMRVTAEKALEKGRLVRENISLRRRVAGQIGFEDIVHGSWKMQRLIETLRRVAPLPTNVLITGESGTGKEMLARAIHATSARGSKPFVVVDCGAIPETLMESELFGHAKGAFTGAVGQKTGLVRAANEGTLFLDEVGELPPSLQVKLLRAIQERTVKPVGSVDMVPVDLRIIAATNRPLEDAVERGDFRTDLYYRLNVIKVEVPPLRDRPEDIPALVDHFVARHCAALGTVIQGVDEDAMAHLSGLQYPGNVRELGNIIERAVALESGDSIRLATIVDGMSPGSRGVTDGGGDEIPVPDSAISGGGLDGVMESVERSILRRYWKRHAGNRREMAEALSISLRSLLYRLAKHGLASETLSTPNLETATSAANDGEDKGR